MKRFGVLLLTSACLLTLPAAAPAQLTGGAPTPSRTGGVQPGMAVKRATKLRIGTFKVAPKKVRAGGRPVVITYRVRGSGRTARVHVDLITSRGRVAKRLELGWRKLRRTHRHRWRLPGGVLEPGTYVARLQAKTADGRSLTRTAAASGRSTLRVVPRRVRAPAPAPSGVFPVRGPHSFGGEGSRFGNDRGTHLHQGQDISAAEGTPLVAPKAGVVTFRAYQAEGAGHYLVIRGDDGRDYVFMHLRTGSLLVDRGARVAAGQQIAQVGSTGRSSGPHLHFEIWPNGWYAANSKPIDPLPELLDWLAGR